MKQYPMTGGQREGGGIGSRTRKGGHPSPPRLPVIEPTPGNARRTLVALRNVGYDVADVTVDDLLTKKLLIRQYALETDIHPFVAGVSFDTVWRNRVRSRIGKTRAGFASLDDLIRMKRAARRPKHLEDLRVLLRLKRKATSKP